MAATLVAHVPIAGSQNGTTSGGIDTSGASLLLAHVAIYTFSGSGSGVFTLSDSKMNSWNILTRHSSSFGDSVWLYAISPATDIAHTFSIAATNGYSVVQIIAFSDADTVSPFDVENGSNGSGTTLATGSVTPTNDGSIIVAGVMNVTSGTFAIDSGFTISDQQSYSGGANMGGAAAYLVQGAKSAVNPTWSMGVALGDAAATIEVFKANASSASSGKLIGGALINGNLIGGSLAA